MERRSFMKRLVVATAGMLSLGLLRREPPPPVEGVLYNGKPIRTLPADGKIPIVYGGKTCRPPGHIVALCEGPVETIAGIPGNEVRAVDNVPPPADYEPMAITGQPPVGEINPDDVDVEAFEEWARYCNEKIDAKQAEKERAERGRIVPLYHNGVHIGYQRVFNADEAVHIFKNRL